MKNIEIQLNGQPIKVPAPIGPEAVSALIGRPVELGDLVTIRVVDQDNAPVTGAVPGNRNDQMLDATDDA
jgi:hypothetical protein